MRYFIVLLGLAVLFNTEQRAIAQSSPTGSVYGLVTDENKEAVIGATVKVEGTTLGAITDFNGKFEINNVPVGEHILTIKSIGLKTISQTVSVTSQKKSEVKAQMETDFTQLDEIVVQGQSEEEIKREQPITVESVRLKKITGQIKNLSEGLDMIAGVRIESTGSQGGAINISLNGIDGNAVRTYVDGLPFEFLYPSLSIANLPLNNLRSIDVYKGVVPVDIGTDALAGAVNVITQTKNLDALKVGYNLGSFNTHELSANISHQVSEKSTLSLNTAYNYSDNDFTHQADARYIIEFDDIFGNPTYQYASQPTNVRRFNDQYKMFFTEGVWFIDQNKWLDETILKISFSDYYKELQHGYKIEETTYGEFFYEGYNYTTQLNLRKELFSKLTLSNNFAYSFNRLHTVDTTLVQYLWSGEPNIDEPFPRRGEASNTPILSERNTHNFIDRFNVSFLPHDNHRILLSNLYAYQGISGRDEMQTIEEDALQQDQFIEKNISGLQYSGSYLNNKLDFDLAGKVYHYSTTGFDTQSEVTKKTESFNGYYSALKYRFSDLLFMRTSYEKAVRIPNSYELFGDGNVIIRNSTLKPETSQNVNLGLVLSSKKKLNFSIDISGFYRLQDNLINLIVRDINTQYENQKGVRTVGVEIDSYIYLFEKLRLSLNLTHLSQIITKQNDNSAGEEDTIGDPNPNQPTFFTNGQIEYLGKRLFGTSNSYRLYIQHKFVDTFNHIALGGLNNPENWVPVQHRVNMGFSYNINHPKITISANVFNILDEELYDNYKLPRPGRNYNMKLTYTISNF